MKNQYFADKRDFLKYDLLLELFDALPEINLLTSILMLTENDQTREGKFKQYPVGGGRKYLHAFLWGCIERGSFDVRNLREFFSEPAFATLKNAKQLIHVFKPLSENGSAQL